MHSILPLVIAGLLQAQAQFEVASVKANVSGRGSSSIDITPAGTATIVNATFKMLLRSAYRLQDYQIVGGPGWLDTERFDVQAKPPSDYQPETVAPCITSDCPFTRVQLMMQGLLADRFQLKSHRDTRELPVYELAIGKSGFKLKEVAAPSPRVPGEAPPPPPPLPRPPPPGTPPPTTSAALPTPPLGGLMSFPFGIAGSAVPFPALVSALAQILGRPVVDKTGIRGYYDFKLAFSREGISGNGPVIPPPGGAGLSATDPAPSIFTALQEEFGLRLDSVKGPVDVLVVDSVQKPSEN